MTNLGFGSFMKQLMWGSLGVVCFILGCAESDSPPAANLADPAAVPVATTPAAVTPAPLPVASEAKPVPAPADVIPVVSATETAPIVQTGIKDEAVITVSKNTPDDKEPPPQEANSEEKPAPVITSDDESTTEKSAKKSTKAQSSPSLITNFLKAFNTPAKSSTTLDSSADIPETPQRITRDSHRRIKVKASAGWLSLQTFCVDHEGQLVALLGTSRYSEDKGKNSEVQILNPEGEVVKEWKLSFPGQSINVGPDYLIYVAGDGKVAKYDNEGNELALVALPHIEEMTSDQDKMRKDAEDLLKQQQESYNKMIESTEQRLTREKENLKDEKSKSSVKAQVEMLEAQLSMYRQMANQRSKQDVGKVMEQQLTRLKIINSIAVSDKDVFLVCGDNKGYGYNLWRTDLGFHDAQVIIKNLRGCCGQMDVQVSGEEIVVAENTLHKFGRYDREGKLIGKYGKKSRNGSADCFGGCCNPMNVRAAANGDVFTAESEGVIKHYSSDGTFQGEIGKCSLTGGCKNVAVAVSPDNKFVYFCDQPGSQIIVLEMPAREVAGKD